jgi:anti-anti-sigma factor
MMSTIINDYTPTNSESSIASLSIKGSICICNIPSISSIISEFISQKKITIILDFSDTHYVESVVWFFLVEKNNELKQLSGDLFISKVNGFVKNEYMLLGLEESLPNINNLEDILNISKCIF